ncbi:unnamed protein product [Musa hybrid cultivar]
MLLVDGKNEAQKMVMFFISNAGQVANSLSLFILMRHLIVRGKSATLPSITEKDWDDIKFGVENNVDFYAVSFVKDAKVVHELKDYLKTRCSVLVWVEISL